MTAALVPGAAVFASGSSDCAEYSPLSEADVRQTPLIVVGTVEQANQAGAEMSIESVLKGSAQGASLSFKRPEYMGVCDKAELESGDRVLLLLNLESGVADWPTVGGTYYLRDGSAQSAHPAAVSAVRERDLIDLITGETEQVVVPVQSESEGEGIEWGTTVLPIAVALGIVFVIGLFLMRIWHRIDPS